MGVLSIVAQLILSLSILVVLHECGHFFPAKWFKTKVEKFYLFFNPGFSLFKKQIGETEYGLGWIPFGGYVKIAGMIDESMDKEQMQGEPQPWEFRSKPAWQRLIIMIGGVTVNFILGFIIFAGILWYFGVSFIPNEEVKYGVYTTELGKTIGIEDGDQIVAIGDLPFEKFEPGVANQEIIINTPQTITVNRDGQEIALPIPADMAKTLTQHENKGKYLFNLRYPHEIKNVKKGSVAEEIGLQSEDRIIGVNGQPTPYIHQFVEAMDGQANSSVALSVLRNQSDTLNLTANLGEDGSLGIFNKLPNDFFNIASEKYGIGEAIPAGVNMGIKFLGDQLKAFGKMFSGDINAKDSLGSVVSIATMFDKSWDWERFWRITAMLSILLGFFNLLPIPALDGGYVMFLIWEVITGRKPSDKVMEYATMAGFIILIALMVFALGLDFNRLFK